MLAGQGLDWQRSGTLLQEVEPRAPSDPISYPNIALTPTPTPPTGKNFFKVNRAALKFSGNCQTISDLVLRCPVKPTPGAAGADTQFCGHWLSEVPTPTVWVYLVNGKPDPNNGGFRFGSVGPQGAFVACSVSDPTNPDEWEWNALGAIGKCLLWPRGPNGVGWIPTSSNDTQLAFNACLRAVRADYCGEGVTHTVDGTQIDLYGVTEKHSSNPPYLLEATWNERGALCIIHARWARLSPTCRGHFTHVLGQPPPPPVSRDGGVAMTPAVFFRMPHGLKAQIDGGTGEDLWTGTEYHCDPGKVPFLTETRGCDSDQANMARALRWGILADDSLLR
jgi:hypothetical protein